MEFPITREELKYYGEKILKERKEQLINDFIKYVKSRIIQKLGWKRIGEAPPKESRNVFIDIKEFKNKFNQINCNEDANSPNNEFYFLNMNFEEFLNIVIEKLQKYLIDVDIVYEDKTSKLIIDWS